MVRNHESTKHSLGTQIILLIALAFAFAACSSDAGGRTSGSTSVVRDSTTATTSTTVASTTEAPAVTSSSTEPPSSAPTTALVDLETVNVYWLTDRGIAVGGRELAADAEAADVMAELLEGPNVLEVELGMASAIPAGTEVLGVTVSDGVATIDLSTEFEATGLGTSGEIGLVAQIVFTLTQFPSVESVDVTIDGEARDAILSHGLEATGLTRAALHDAIAPAIVVESPYPGQVVTSPLAVRGFSRTFEASIVYSVVLPSGEIIDEGFTTALQPDVHLFGPFEFTTEFETAVGGFGSVIVWEESARDGSQINVYEVPVRMEP